MLLDVPYHIVFFQASISCTGGQSVSHMLLWQPSECVHLIVMNDCVMLFSENKYDDDDDDDNRCARHTDTFWQPLCK